MKKIEKNKEWIKNRQSLAWEPEILISGIVLIGLLQLPKYIDGFILYLNDWGSPVFYFTEIDEWLGAWVTTSIYFLVAGLILNLLLRSVWVVMIGMSFTFPKGFDPDKFSFQTYFRKKLANLPSLEENIIQLDKLCSLIYATTFLVFMCLVGVFFFLFIYTGTFLFIYAIWPFKSATFELAINMILQISLAILSIMYFLDFVTMGWLKRISWYTKIYRPVYALMSILTLAPLYRNIYYNLIGNFSRWKIYTGFFLLIGLAGIAINAQVQNISLIDRSNFNQLIIGYAAIDGHYRDENAVKASRWISIDSKKISDDFIEVFINHKVALEDSILSRYSKTSGFSVDKIKTSSDLRLKAVAEFYRVKVDTLMMPPVNYRFFHYSKIKQKGFRGFVDVSAFERGEYELTLELGFEKPIKAGSIPFVKTQGKVEQINQDLIIP